MAEFYPPVGFHFLVEFSGLEAEEADIRFQSVAGLTVNLDTEDVSEGGENRFKHKLPLRTSYPNLTLKRGVVVGSALITWCRDALENFIFEPKDLTIKLLNEQHEPLQTWNIVHAYPVKWAVDDFNAQESKLVLETLELNYHYFNTIN
jgi:phage tail-like protein